MKRQRNLSHSGLLLHFLHTVILAFVTGYIPSLGAAAPGSSLMIRLLTHGITVVVWFIVEISRGEGGKIYSLLFVVSALNVTVSLSRRAHPEYWDKPRKDYGDPVRGTAVSIRAE